MPEPIVLLTRSVADNETLARDLRARGARTLELPCVHIAPLEDSAALGEALARLGPEDRLVFTSRAGVDAARAVLPGAHLRAPVCAVGAVTAARCLEWGVRAWTPSEATGAALGRELPLGTGVVVLARADRADPALPRELRARGAHVKELAAYRVIGAARGDVAAARDALRSGATAVLASPSAATALAEAVGADAFAAARLLALGPTTSRRVRELRGTDAKVIAALGAEQILQEVVGVAHR